MSVCLWMFLLAVIRFFWMLPEFPLTVLFMFSLVINRSLVDSLLIKRKTLKKTISSHKKINGLLFWKRNGHFYVILYESIYFRENCLLFFLLSIVKEKFKCLSKTLYFPLSRFCKCSQNSHLQLCSFLVKL